MEFCFGHFLRGKKNLRELLGGLYYLNHPLNLIKKKLYARYRYRWKERNVEICFSSFAPKVGMAHFH